MTPPIMKSSILSLQYFCYPDEVGGAWKYTYEVNKRLARRGYNVFQITCKPREDLPDYEVIDGIHYFRIGAAESKGFFSLRRALRKKIRLARDYGPIHRILAHNPLIDFLTLGAQGLSAAPRTYHFYSSWHDEEKINLTAAQKDSPFSLLGSLKLWMRLSMIRCIEWTSFFFADQVLFLSEYTRRRFLDYYPLKKKRLLMVPGGVDVEAFRPTTEETFPQRNKLGLPESVPILLTVRRLEARMGLDNLIDAAALVRDRLPDADFFLAIVGKGSLETKLRDQIERLGLQERVRLFGKLDADCLTDIYRAADLFVLPTTEIEGFGLVTVEALASGIPVMGTPVGATAEILNRVDPAWLFKDAGPSAIADGLEKFLKDPKPFADKKALCRQVAVGNYGWDQIVDRLEEELFDAGAKFNRESGQ